MPQRRSPFSYGDGSGGGASPLTAMPMTGTGTGTGPGEVYNTDLDPAMTGVESPATLRRRLMPVAGKAQVEPDVLQAVMQMVQQRQGGG